MYYCTGHLASICTVISAYNIYIPEDQAATDAIYNRTYDVIVYVMQRVVSDAVHGKLF
jgi:hypothetical protein